MKALYRKYRPVKLSDVVGEDQVTAALKNAISSKKISHAYLFIGPRGCGKTSVARIFAHEINEFKYELEDSYADIIEIDAASNTGVDNIRELRERALIAPTIGKYKVYIIDEVHMLSKAAFNALLKTLEEPPAHVVFIMATTDAYKIPVTITSRAQTFTFHLASPDVMAKHLKSIAEKEKVKVTDDAINLIVSRGGGSFRDTISLFDQISTISDSEITEQSIINILGLPDNKVVNDLISAYEAGDFQSISNSIERLLSTGTKPEIIAESIINYIVKHPSPTLIPLLSTLPSVTAPFPEAKLLVAMLSPFSQKSTPSISRATVAPTKSTSHSAPKQSVETADQATEQPSSLENKPDTFNQEVFLNMLSTKSTAVHNIVAKSTITVSGKNIRIAPHKAFYRNILEKANNRKAIDDITPVGYSVTIVDQDAKPMDDPILAQVSDIMGGVEDINAGDPFNG